MGTHRSVIVTRQKSKKIEVSEADKKVIEAAIEYYDSVAAIRLKRLEKTKLRKPLHRLCRRYLSGHPSCKGCPIRAKTGMAFCIDTPLRPHGGIPLEEGLASAVSMPEVAAREDAFRRIRQKFVKMSELLKDIINESN